MNKRKVGEWVHRIIGFTIFESLIAVVGFVGIYTSITVLAELDKLTLGVSIGLVQAALAIAYLQVANIFYWIFGENLFDFKSLWRKNETKR